MNEKIVDFIMHQRLANICCVDEKNFPYCFSCFYAFDKVRELFYFKSGADAHHCQIFKQNSIVAGTIQPDKLNPLAVRGIQLTGQILLPKNELCLKADAIYHQRYPFALAMPGTIWTLQPEIIKMTDNTLSFGKKLHWRLHELV
jgi:uncharacterized protein